MKRNSVALGATCSRHMRGGVPRSPPWYEGYEWRYYSFVLFYLALAACTPPLPSQHGIYASEPVKASSGTSSSPHPAPLVPSASPFDVAWNGEIGQRPTLRVLQFRGPGVVHLSDGSIHHIGDGRRARPDAIKAVAPMGVVILHDGKLRFLGTKGPADELPNAATSVVLSSSTIHGCLWTPSGVWCPSVHNDCAHRIYSDSYGPPGSDQFPFKGLWCKLDLKVEDVLSLDGEHTVGCLVEGGTKKLYCWRAGDRVREVRIGTSPIKQVAASSEHMCVLNEDGEVACWGDGSFGELGYVAQKVSDYAFELQTGNPRFVQLTPPPRFLDLPAPAEQIFAAERISCAWLVDGQLWCWGDLGPMAFDGMDPATNAVDRMSLGYNSRRLPIYKPRWSSTLPTHPVKMPSDCQPEHIAVFFKTICIACDTGCAQCWGYNDHNALGYGDSNERGEPTNECYSF